MSVHRFERVQVLPLTREAAWAFFSDPGNLSRITPPDMAFQVTSPLPPAAYAGLMIRYRVRPLLGIPVTWVTEITHVQPRDYFVDEQRIGPYRLWHHEHHFREVPGGVEMRDIVHYALPLGALGAWIDRLIVGPRVARIFAYRRQVLARMFGEAASPPDAAQPRPDPPPPDAAPPRLDPPPIAAMR
jgi:ligand-binding SRPBCC domain-containing protein